LENQTGFTGFLRIYRKKSGNLATAREFFMYHPLENVPLSGRTVLNDEQPSTAA
jgi:hypothetical protein